jgi:hypothetical protein
MTAHFNGIPADVNIIAAIVECSKALLLVTRPSETAFADTTLWGHFPFQQRIGAMAADNNR